MRRVEAKDIIINAQTLRKVFRQKQCYPAPNHYLILVESASCKNSETSCLESNFDIVKQLTRLDKRIVKIALSQYHQSMRPGIEIQDTIFEHEHPTQPTEHVKRRWFLLFILYVHTRTSWDCGWCKKDIASRLVGNGLCTRENRQILFSANARGNQQQEPVHECCTLCPGGTCRSLPGFPVVPFIHLF